LLLTVIGLAASPAASAQQSPDPELKRLLLEAVNSSESFPDRFEAQVWLTDMSARLARQVPDPQERVDILQHVHYAAGRTDLPPELVLAVIDVESNFDRYAISVAGARGLMQIMPFWLEELNRPDGNLFEIETNLRMGCTILRYYLDMGDEDLASALARYNGSYGRSARYPQKVLGKLSSRWFRQ
jgi:soluble lytic murein transglycosylase-like protein